MTWDDPVRGLSGMIPQVKDCVKNLEVTNYGASDAIPNRFPVNKTLTDGLCMVHQTGCAATRYNMVCSLHILNILYYFIHTTSYRSIFPSLELETKDLVGSGLILRFIALPFLSCQPGSSNHLLGSSHVGWTVSTSQVDVPGMKNRASVSDA